MLLKANDYVLQVIMIGSRLWSIREHTHDHVIITKLFPLCFKMAVSLEHLDNILRDKAKDKVQQRLEHWKGMRSTKNKEKSVSFLVKITQKKIYSAVKRDQTKHKIGLEISLL